MQLRDRGLGQDWRIVWYSSQPFSLFLSPTGQAINPPSAARGATSETNAFSFSSKVRIPCGWRTTRVKVRARELAVIYNIPPARLPITMVPSRPGPRCPLRVESSIVPAITPSGLRRGQRMDRMHKLYILHTGRSNGTFVQGAEQGWKVDRRWRCRRGVARY